MLFILFHCTIFIWVHLDAQISGARVLFAVICCYLSELEDLLFLLRLICASYGHELYMCFDVCHAIFRGVCHVFLWSLWWLAQACKLGFVMFLISETSWILCPRLLLVCCYVSMWLQRDPCLFWRCSVMMFCRYGCTWSIRALVCNYGVPWHNSILLYFCYKIFLADC